MGRTETKEFESRREPPERRRSAVIPATARTRAGAACVLFVCAATIACAAGGGPVRPFEKDADDRPAGRIDELVFGKLKAGGIERAYPCSDEVFLRRVYLDAIGVLPTAAEAEEFLDDRAPGKRSALIDRLLDRPEFVDYWAMKWADMLRLKAEFPIKLWPKGAQAYHRWIRECIAGNRSYDRMAREMLLATGSNFYVPEVNFYRAMQMQGATNIAQTAALTFMGTRADRWPRERLSDMAAFFSQVSYKGTSEWKEEIVYLDPTKLTGGRARLPDGTEVELPPGGDARAVFADWLISDKNPWFARAAVNRIWYWLFGRGIIHEPDDIRPDNPPANEALMRYLEEEFAASGWDMRRMIRLILNSKTYQLSSIPRSNDPGATANFAHYPVRRLDAEVLIDALCRVTGTTERYVSAVPEPFTYVPEEMRTVELSDGNSSSAFLETFGRPARDTGLASERDNSNSAEQRRELLNSTRVHKKITQGPALLELAARAKQPREMVRALYLTVLSRYPTDREIAAVVEYRESAGIRGRDMLTDLVWALINSEEFLHRH